MKDFEEFDKLVNDYERGELANTDNYDDYLQIVQAIKSSQPHPTPAARSASQKLMLEEAGKVGQVKQERRLVNLGRLFAFAVPVLLVFVVTATVLTSRRGDVDQLDPAVQPGSPGQQSEGVLPTVEAETDLGGETPLVEEAVPVETEIMTATRITTEGTASEPITGQMEEAIGSGDQNLSEESTETGSNQVTVPDGEGGEIVLPQPQLPLPGAGIEPPVDGEMIVPRPGDGREDGRNPDS